MIHANGQTDVTKLIVAFRNSAKVSKNFIKETTRWRRLSITVLVHILWAVQIYCLWRIEIYAGEDIQTLSSEDGDSRYLRKDSENLLQSTALI